MHLNTVLPAVNFQICGGSEFLWPCYGPNARYLDLNNKAQDEREMGTCVFDTCTQEVYEMDICTEDVGYKWYNPAYFNKMLDAAKTYNVDYTEAWDDIKWIIITSEDEMLNKLKEILTT